MVNILQTTLKYVHGICVKMQLYLFMSKFTTEKCRDIQ